MIAANHERPAKSAWHELLATISARDTVDHGSRSLHIVTSRNCRRGLPAQSNLLLLIWFLFVVFASAQTAGPVTLFAGLAGWTEVLYGRRNGARKGVERY